MNREWKRVPTDCFCGLCMPQRLIPKGEAALFIRVPGVTRPRVRCQNCAGAAPPDLPELMMAGGIEPSRLTRIGAAAPGRTRGELRTAVKEWMPFKESREPGSDDE